MFVCGESAREVLRDLVGYEYPGRSLTPEQERAALDLMKWNQVKRLKAYLDSTLGPAKDVGPVADLPTARI